MSATITGFLTDSTLCIGCKACEVACKEWNGIAEDGLNWTGNSYDNTGSLSYSTWRHVKFVEGQPQPGVGGNDAQHSLVGIFLRRLQALRSCRLPGGLPHRRNRPHRVRRRVYPAGCV